MHMSRSVRRGLVIAAAASGLLALGAGAASADQPLPGTKGTKAIAGATTAARSAGGAVQHTFDNTHDDGAGKAARNVTQATGETVSEAAAAPAHQDLGPVSRFAAQAAPSSAPGLPEDLVIEIPAIVPGVPSIGVIPSSIPQLPVTPGLPAL